MPTPTEQRGALRGSTLVELIVVILSIGVLAGLAAVGYTQLTAHARDTAACTELRTMGPALLVEATLNDVELLDRSLVLSALEDAYSAPVYDPEARRPAGRCSKPASSRHATTRCQTRPAG